MPIVAVASAGASLTPSPTIATGPISLSDLSTRLGTGWRMARDFGAKLAQDDVQEGDNAKRNRE
jgi:hypothetical protein